MELYVIDEKKVSKETLMMIGRDYGVVRKEDENDQDLIDRILDELVDAEYESIIKDEMERFGRDAVSAYDEAYKRIEYFYKLYPWKEATY